MVMSAIAARLVEGFCKEGVCGSIWYAGCEVAVGPSQRCEVPTPSTVSESSQWSLHTG